MRRLPPSASARSFIVTSPSAPRPLLVDAFAVIADLEPHAGIGTFEIDFSRTKRLRKSALYGACLA